MAGPFDAWTARIAEASDEKARRALLGELGVWRAARLTDILAQREAAYALSVVYDLLGERQHAAHEAQQLVALAKLPPAAPRKVQGFVDKHARRVARPPQASGPPNSGPWAEAAVLAREGAHEAARHALQGRKGGRAALFRAWTHLAEALELEGEARDAALVTLRDRVFKQLGLDEAPPEADAPAVEEQAPPSEATTALAALVGRPIPRRRNPLVNVLEAWLAEHPDRADELAAAALRHHVGQHGERAVAPWLVGLTARALASEGAERTAQALTDLQGAYAVTAYGEPPFRVLVGVLGALDGWTPGDLRRGVLRRGGLADRVMWTLRATSDGTEVLIAVAPPSDAPVDEAVVSRVVSRLASLAERVLLVAPGAGYAALREATAAAGMSVRDDADPAAIVAALGDVTPHAPAPEVAAAEDAAPTGPDPLDALRTAFTATPPDEAAYPELLGQLDRSWRAFLPLRDVLPTLEPADADARLAPLLTAVHHAAPPEVRLAEGVTVAMRAAAAAPGGAVESLLRAGDGVSSRYGGAEILGLVEVARALSVDGLALDRVLVGVTRREERTTPALGALAPRATGLWRLVVRRGDDAGEVWWLDHPSAEAKAAVPLLLQTSRPHVVVVADGQGLDTELGVPPGTTLLVWTAEAAPALREAVAAWSLAAQDAG